VSGHIILWDAMALGVHRPEQLLCVGIPLVRRQSVPPHRLGVILWHAFAGGVLLPEVDLRGGIPASALTRSSATVSCCAEIGALNAVARMETAMRCM